MKIRALHAPDLGQLRRAIDTCNSSVSWPLDESLCFNVTLLPQSTIAGLGKLEESSRSWATRRVHPHHDGRDRHPSSPRTPPKRLLPGRHAVYDIFDLEALPPVDQPTSLRRAPYRGGGDFFDRDRAISNVPSSLAREAQTRRFPLPGGILFSARTSGILHFAVCPLPSEREHGQRLWQLQRPCEAARVKPSRRCQTVSSPPRPRSFPSCISHVGCGS